MANKEKMISSENKEGSMEKIARYGRMIGGASIAFELIKLLGADPAAADEKELEKIAALRNAATQVQPAEAKHDLVKMMKDLDITFDDSKLDEAISKIQHSPIQTASEKHETESTR